MQSNPTLLPNKFDGQLDRLSCLISRFRVQATVVMPNKVYVEPANFFVFETADKRIELIFCPHVDTLSALSGKCSKSISGEIVAAALISITGAGEHLVAALADTIHVSMHDVPALEAIISPIVEEVRHPRCGGQAVLLRLTEVLSSACSDMLSRKVEPLLVCLPDLPIPGCLLHLFRSTTHRQNNGVLRGWPMSRACPAPNLP